MDIGETRVGRTLNLGEIGEHKPMEKMAETEFMKDAIALEAFMNEMLEIEVHPSSMDGALDVVTPQVNGLNQPIICGRRQWVKRKYVEALARCRTTRYEQRVVDPSRPENIQMVEKIVQSYPFTIHEDKNPKGRAWLMAIQQSQ